MCEARVATAAPAIIIIMIIRIKSLLWTILGGLTSSVSTGWPPPPTSFLPPRVTVEHTELKEPDAVGSCWHIHTI